MKTPLCGLLAALQFISAGFVLAQSAPPLTTKLQPQAIRAGARRVANVITNPTPAVLAVSPRSLQFAPVTVGGARTLTFKVRNAGTTLLAGTAKVSAPFRIVSGSRYALAGSQGQDITVQFVPKQAGMYVAVVRLTGGGSARLIVSGSAFSPLPPPTPRREARGLRLLAER